MAECATLSRRGRCSLAATPVAAPYVSCRVKAEVKRVRPVNLISEGIRF
jgi:hypothetical protein